MTLPSAWSSLMTSRKEYLSFHAFVQHARAGLLLGRLLTQKEAAAEFRVHGIGPFLLGHSAPWPRPASPSRPGWPAAPPGSGSSRTARGLRHPAHVRRALGGLLRGGAMDPAVAGTAVSAIRTGGASLDTLVLQITELHQKSLFVADFEQLCREAKDRPFRRAVSRCPSGCAKSASRAARSPAPPARLPCRNRRCATSACPSRPGRSPRWWARPAQASPPSSNSWPACTRRTRAAA